MNDSDAAPLRAYSYKAALDAGLAPERYDWKSVPEGLWRARLDFKIWSDRTAAGHLVCYFTRLDDGQLYRLSAYRPARDVERRYTAKDGAIDFSSPDTAGETFLIVVGRNSKGNLAWLSAQRAAD
ncbi:hypothetical protein J5226_06005 [Lysobacter sp. K5869]|uniref:hypothetical protein n=1 Tax=Lysobacter sp. K5869 TaxID=2820808 RepID=UPI001C0617D8|nr:hypothetical protein [Lysobacter sp. K5869]QWP77957.1 hypothetical protein J5226_06005 [Lysobacter sp. K5869]